jgi:hypothetical protein
MKQAVAAAEPVVQVELELTREQLQHRLAATAAQDYILILVELTQFMQEEEAAQLIPMLQAHQLAGVELVVVVDIVPVQVVVTVQLTLGVVVEVVVLMCLQAEVVEVALS